MPSIRVKGQAYSSLPDGYTLEDYDVPANNQPSSPSPGPLLRVTPRISTRLSLPFLRGEPSDGRLSARISAATPVTPNRPRAATTASRVHAHCTSASGIRSSQFWSPTEDANSPGLPSPVPSRTLSGAYPQAGGMVTLEGMQTDLRMSSQGEPGLIEHSINLSHTEDEGDVDLHHDDVVDHLDVIGKTAILFHCKTAAHTDHLKDMQIGAFSNLTNAANSIVMYVVTIYSLVKFKPCIIALPLAGTRASQSSFFPLRDETQVMGKVRKNSRMFWIGM